MGSIETRTIGRKRSSQSDHERVTVQNEGSSETYWDLAASVGRSRGTEYAREGDGAGRRRGPGLNGFAG